MFGVNTITDLYLHTNGMGVEAFKPRLKPRVSTETTGTNSVQTNCLESPGSISGCTFDAKEIGIMHISEKMSQGKNT